MSEYINREVLLRKIRWADTVEEAFVSIRRMPSADVMSVRHGKWIVAAGGKQCDCSACGERFDNTCNYDIRKDWKYCPECGARMEGD